MATTALSWEEIVERGKQHNKTVICEVEKRGIKRYFKIKCIFCGEEKEARFDGFEDCRTCLIDLLSSNTEEFIKKATIIHGNKYNYDLVEYKKSNIKIKIFCNNCQNIFEQTPGSHLYGKGCKICHLSNIRCNTEEFILKASIIHGNLYNYDLVEYVDSNVKIKIKCNQCQNVFEQRPRKHLSNHGCPKCNESKGEIRVARYLQNINELFQSQYKFPNCKYVNCLVFDFYIVSLNVLIEYDGIGHYEPSFGSSAEERQKKLEEQQKRDKIKTEWAKSNNIPLLRIPYWDFDRIEELIEAFILKHTKKKEIKQLVLEM